MKTKTFILSIVTILTIGSIIFIKPTFADAPPRELSDYSPKEIISYYSKLYGGNEPVLMEMARIESGFDQKKCDPDDGGSPSCGLFAYKRATFDRHAKLMGEKLDYYSYHDQAKLAVWMYVNHPESRPEWTTYRCIKNHGSYTFKYEGGYHTVYCNGDLVI